jgi:type I restriction enzyme S subunit
MELMPGYKRSDVGMIPIDWDISALGKLTTLVASGRSAIGKQTGDYPIYGSTGIIGYTMTPEYDGDAILAARVGANAGRLNYVSGKYGVTDNTIIIRMNRDCCLPFFWRQLEAKRLNNLVFGSGQPLITGTQLKALPLAIPSPAEQRAIAQALSDVDTLLATLDQVIAKKRDLKQAAMQQLLTGDIQLAGFNKKWLEVPLGEIVKPQKGQLITKNTTVPGDIPVIAGGKQPAYFHASANRYGKTITVSASGASAGYVAFHSAPIFASDCSTISESEKYCIEFIYYALQLRQEEIYAAQTGGAQPHIQPKDLAPILIKIPEDVTEQAAIASVLSDMDTEIAELEARRNKTSDIKQAMMQELLTGKTRLV